MGAKILPRFQFEGETDVWISQVRRVKEVRAEILKFLYWLTQKRHFEIDWFFKKYTDCAIRLGFAPNSVNILWRLFASHIMFHKQHMKKQLVFLFVQFLLRFIEKIGGNV